MKKLISLFLALSMLCSCGRAMPQEEIPQPEAPKVSEEQPADVDTDEVSEEVIPIEEETEVNPNTNPQPQIEHTQPPVEIIHLPNQELSPTPLKEAEKVNPNTDPSPSTEEPKKEVSEQEPYNGPAIGSVFDVSVLDDLQDLHRAIHASNVYFNNKLVDTDHRMMGIEDKGITNKIIEELKYVLNGSIVVKPTKELEAQLYQPGPKVWFRATKNLDVDVYPNFTYVWHNDSKYYLGTNEEQYYALAELVKRYDETGYDTNRMTLSENSFYTLEGATIHYKEKSYQFDDDTRKAFLNDLTELVAGKGSIFTTEEIKQAYLNKDYWATIEYHQYYSSEYHFGDGFILLEGDSNLQFYYAGNIQDELHDLFEKYTN